MAKAKAVKLTAKQEALLKGITQELRRETALAFISNGYQNQTQAYLAACKSMKKKPSKNPETSASEILGYPNVVEFLDSVKVVIAEEALIDAAWLLKSAKQVFDRCMQNEQVIVAGEPTGEYKFDSTGANKALDTIGKHVDVNAFKHIVEHSGEVVMFNMQYGGADA